MPPHARCNRYTPLHAHCHRYTLSALVTAIATHRPPHGRLWRHATRSRPSLYAVTRSLSSPYTTTWPPRASCYNHSRHYTPPRARPSPHAAALSLPSPHAATWPPPAPRYILTAVGATLHTHGRHYTPPRSLPSPHAADMPHAVAQLNMARMLHVLCTVSRDHCTVRVCCRFSVLYDLS